MWLGSPEIHFCCGGKEEISVIIHFIHCNSVQIIMLCYIGTSCQGAFHAGHLNMYITVRTKGSENIYDVFIFI